jgi:hypothetical protein
VYSSCHAFILQEPGKSWYDPSRRSVHGYGKLMSKRLPPSPITVNASAEFQLVGDEYE